MTVPVAEEEAAVAVLWEHRTTGIEVRPGAEGQAVLLAYFDEAPDVAVLVGDALSAVRGARVERAAVPDVDWVGRFRESFAAFQVGGFSIVPAWERPPTDGRPALVVDPGPAFGTGTHETTRLCLRALEGRLALGPRPRNALDLGTGSGILALAAARLGVGFVVGVDSDPDAVASARHHAALNHLELHLVEGDGGRPFRPGSFELVLANLSASLLLERRDEIVGLLAPRATLILSGLLAADSPSVRHAYLCLGEPEVRTDGEWVALVLERGGRP